MLCSWIFMIVQWRQRKMITHSCSVILVLCCVILGSYTAAQLTCHFEEESEKEEHPLMLWYTFQLLCSRPVQRKRWVNLLCVVLGRWCLHLCCAVQSIQPTHVVLCVMFYAVALQRERAPTHVVLHSLVCSCSIERKKYTWLCFVVQST